MYAILFVSGDEPVQAMAPTHEAALEIARVLCRDHDRAVIIAEKCEGKVCIRDMIFPEHPADYLEREGEI